MYTALDIAYKLLKASMNDSFGELMSNMKLQKMLYYQQGFHLAVFGTPLFDDEIEAWMYGPVVPAVYEAFKHYDNRGIEWEGDTVMLEKEEERLFRDVMNVYGVYSTYGLMRATHDEMPWKSTPTGRGNIISKDKMREFFANRIK